jgi:hypothetical protein
MSSSIIPSSAVAFRLPHRTRTPLLTLERLAVVGMVVVTAGLLVTKPASVRYAFPVTAVAVGAFLYLRASVRYVSFTLWLYFLSPFIRRVSESRSSWMTQSPILLAPLLVTLLTGPVLLRRINRSWFSKDTWPFEFALIGIGLGALCGLLISKDKKDVLAACINWVAPICFGHYMTCYPLDRAVLKRVVIRTFVTGILVMGVYGIYQFIKAPAWDCDWLDFMTNGDMAVSVMGRPEPFGIRVWSTMNSPGPFSTAATAALLLVFVDKRLIRVPAALSGFVALLLSLVRSGWLGWGVGLLSILASCKKYISRVLLTLGAGLLLLLPALQYKPFADAVETRLQTLQTIGSDESANARASEYESLEDEMVRSPFGLGLTNKDRLKGYVLDSTLLRLPLQLGWLGCLFYVAGLGLLVRGMFPLRRELDFGVIARAIAISALVRAPFGQILVNFDGLILWMFCGLAVAEASQLAAGRET